MGACRTVVCVAVLSLGCGGAPIVVPPDGDPADTGSTDAGNRTDSGSTDTGVALDVPLDVPLDGSTVDDAAVDAAVPEAAGMDAAGMDAGVPTDTPADTQVAPDVTVDAPSPVDSPVTVDVPVDIPVTTDVAVTDAATDAGSPVDELFVTVGGSATSGCTVDQPCTVERAQTVARARIAAGLHPGGLRITLAAGLYQRTTALAMDATDSGDATHPVVWRAAPGATVRLVGGAVIPASAFVPVPAGAAITARLDPTAVGHVVQVDLGALGLHDYGTLTPRGTGSSTNAAMELFWDGRPLTLARWPDADTDTPPAPTDGLGATVTLYGPAPASGTYDASGTHDGVNAYTRRGTVGGLTYRLYRWRNTAGTVGWFATTAAVGTYPSDTNPWWYRYDTALGSMTARTPAGATGTQEINDPNAVHGGLARTSGHTGTTGITLPTDRLTRWVTAEAPLLHGFFQYDWADTHVAVSHVDGATRTLTLAAPPRVYGLDDNRPYYAYNLVEEITEPGEWWVDRAHGMLYVWAPTAAAGHEAVVSTMEAPLWTMNGTHDVTVQGLTLEATRASLVTLVNTQRVTWRGDTLRNAGKNAVTVTGSATGLDGCTVQAPGDSGVTLSGGDRPSLTAAGNFVRGTLIERFSRWSWTYTPAVQMAGVGDVVTQNEFRDAPHTAVLFTGNDHHVSLNSIHDVCQRVGDAGAVYTGRDWGARGNVVENNFIHHIGSTVASNVHAIYLDDCVSGVTVQGNVVYQVTGGGLMHGGGRDDIMVNNVLVNVGAGLYSDSRGISWITNTPGDSWDLVDKLKTAMGVTGTTASALWLSRYPALAGFPLDWSVLSAGLTTPPRVGATWLYPGGSVFSRNVVFRAGVYEHESNYGGTGTFVHFAERAGNLEGTDPLFVNEAALDFTLRPDSPARAIPGWVDIPFSRIGLPH